jgi:Flp pilus assembly protein TadG
MAALSLFRRLRELRHDRGAEIIELAIALPILLLVLAGIMDFGFLFERYEVVTNAAREGARMAVLSNSAGYSTTDVQNRVTSYLNTSGLTGSSATTDVSYTTQTLPSGLTVQVATVTVTYPSSFLFIGPIAALVGGGSPGTVSLTAVSVMRVEGAGS